MAIVCYRFRSTGDSIGPSALESAQRSRSPYTCIEVYPFGGMNCKHVSFSPALRTGEQEDELFFSSPCKYMYYIKTADFLVCMYRYAMQGK